jgi:AcrR family transcriptional regulator
MPSRTLRGGRARRPADSGEAENRRRAAIALSAERLFGQHGYEGVSIREIAADAQVNSALIRYHFGRKEDLYRQLFERRYEQITHDRLTQLRALDVQPNRLETVRAIVGIWNLPILRLANDPASRDFLLLLAREAADMGNDKRRIYRSYLDELSQECIEALARAVPQASRPQVVQAYVWMNAAAMSAIMTAGRVARLQKLKVPRKVPVDAMAGPLEVFVAHGLWALLRGSAG